MSDELLQKAIEYHTLGGRSGKIATSVTKPTRGREDLSLAYTPGVGYVCRMIADGGLDVDSVTNRGNVVAVVSDGTAVLGLGNIGPKAGLPVMEGKVVLNKIFADIDGLALCVDTRQRSPIINDQLSMIKGKDGKQESRNESDSPDEAIERMVAFVKALEPSVGAVNLEDIKAPECFEIERRLQEMSIPVFHDDQHGTAIISLAALTTSLRLIGKKIGEVKVVVVGAGAAAIACSKLWIKAGVKKKNLVMVDSKGVVTEDRCGCECEGVNEFKCEFASKSGYATLSDAMNGADVFLGLSKKGVLTREMVATMAKDAIVFACANPDPEILYDEAIEAGARIVATGRCDFPNQVNNVLGYPGIFRGALDCKATEINEEMKLAASKALSDLANEVIPKDVLRRLQGAYPDDDFGDPWTHIIPKVFDPRVVPAVARAVVEAAMKTGVARQVIGDLKEYEEGVRGRMAKD